MSYEIRLPRCESTQFVQKPGTLDTVSDREMLYRPGLYGWDMNKVEFVPELKDYAMRPAFIPMGYRLNEKGDGLVEIPGFKYEEK